MSIHKKTGDTSPSVNLELSGKHLRRREQQAGALDPYDARRTFETVKEAKEILRRRREQEVDAIDQRAAPHPPETEEQRELLRRRREDANEEPREQHKRIKFEIVDDPKGTKGGYDPYDAS